MKNKFLHIFILFLFISCCSVSPGWKTLDLNAFKISIPQNWTYVPQQGVDSFVGAIHTPKSNLEFDCSGHGYANHLLPTVDEYLKSGEWMMDCPLYKVGVTYTAAFNVTKEKLIQAKKKGLTDTNQVKVEADPCYMAKKNFHLPTSDQHIKYPKADYIADLTYKGETTYMSITIPGIIKLENFQVDSTQDYVIKTIWPKTAGRGLTGVYIKSRKSDFNFNLAGVNLSKEDQELALQVFKSIEFKK